VREALHEIALLHELPQEGIALIGIERSAKRSDRGSICPQQMQALERAGLASELAFLTTPSAPLPMMPSGPSCT
jgi:hypothetical protein